MELLALLVGSCYCLLCSVVYSSNTTLNVSDALGSSHCKGVSFFFNQRGVVASMLNVLCYLLFMVTPLLTILPPSHCRIY